MAIYYSLRNIIRKCMDRILGFSINFEFRFIMPYHNCFLKTITCHNGFVIGMLINFGF